MSWLPGGRSANRCALGDVVGFSSGERDSVGPSTSGPPLPAPPPSSQPCRAEHFRLHYPALPLAACRRPHPAPDPTGPSERSSLPRGRSRRWPMQSRAPPATSGDPLPHLFHSMLFGLVYFCVLYSCCILLPLGGWGDTGQVGGPAGDAAAPPGRPACRRRQHMLLGGSPRPGSPSAAAARAGSGEGPEFVRAEAGRQHGGRAPHPHEWAALPGDIHPAQLAKAVRSGLPPGTCSAAASLAVKACGSAASAELNPARRCRTAFKS